MLKLDNNLLDELGLGSLPDDQKRAMLQHIYETLELRVGTNLANQMSDQQLEEFEKFIDEGGDANQAQALQWLETNLPNYKEVVNQVFEALKGEIKQMAPQLVASSAQQAAAMPQTASAPQQQAPADYQAPQAAQPQYGAPQQPSYAQPQAPQPSYQQPPQPAADPYATPQQTAPAPQPLAAQQQPYPPLASTGLSDDQQQAQAADAAIAQQGVTPQPQFPQQQPPAGPGAAPQPPQYPPQQAQ